MSQNWGPKFIVPTDVIKKYSGQVLLRETLDKELALKDLAELGLPQEIVRITNPWYCRSKGTETWIKIGESDDEERNFPVSWDTTQLQNGSYEILGLMHVLVNKDGTERVIARQTITQVNVEN
jgi:hypothetical protein